MDDSEREDQRASRYNSSSLAVDVHDRKADEHMLYVVPVPAVTRSSVRPVRTVPTFGSLDAALAERNPRSRVTSAILHVVMIGTILYLGSRMPKVIAPAQSLTHVDFKLFAPPPPAPKILPVAPKQGGGGGGGAHQIVEPTRGRAPEVAKVTLNAPQLMRLDHPKLPVEPTEPIKLPDNSRLANLGLPDSAQVKLASQGNGGGSGFGHGLGGGLGSGKGLGGGPGSGGGYGGGVMGVGGGVSAPVLIHSIDPEFSDQARQANLQGTVALQLIVDAEGNPQNIRVTRSLGMGLDEKAVEAVRQYKFRPAMYQGHPVAVQMVVDVEFHLH
jgi:periplasmic protein TonB